MAGWTATHSSLAFVNLVGLLLVFCLIVIGFLTPVGVASHGNSKKSDPPNIGKDKLCSSLPDSGGKCDFPLNRSGNVGGTNLKQYNTTVQTIYEYLRIEKLTLKNGKPDATMEFYVNGKLKLSFRANSASANNYWIDGNKLKVRQQVKLPPGNNLLAVRVVDNFASTSAQKDMAYVFYPNHAPTLQMVTPSNKDYWSGTKTIKWDAKDIDDDPLAFTVEYSTDGKTFTTLAANIADSRYVWDTKSVPDNDSYTIRVAVSDGMAKVANFTTLTVDNMPPKVALALEPLLSEYLVTSPLPVEHFEADPQVSGKPSGIASTSWDIDGMAMQDMNISDWIGKHKLTLTIADRAGNKNSASVEFVGITPEGCTTIDCGEQAALEANSNGKMFKGATVKTTAQELQALQEAASQQPHTLLLRSGSFTPGKGIDDALSKKNGSDGYTYAYLMFNKTASSADLDSLRSLGVKLLSSHDYYSYSARIPMQNISKIAGLNSIYWMGYLPADYKLDPVLQKALDPNKTFDDATNENYKLFEDYLKANGLSLDNITVSVSTYQLDLSGDFGEKLGQAGLTGEHEDETLAVFYGTASIDAAKKMAGLGFVNYVNVVLGGSTALLESSPTIGADYLSFVNGQIMNGAGVRVGIIDSGYDNDHPWLPNYGSCRNFLDNNNDCSDTHGHGNYVAGILLGQDARHRGIAYGVTGPKIAKVTDSSGNFNDATVLSAMDWMAQDPVPSVVSVSLADPMLKCTGTDDLSRRLDSKVSQNGQVYVVAAGNNGNIGAQRVGMPGCAKNAITVGATTDYDTTDSVWMESQRGSSYGPTGDGRIKPDLVAPGCLIESAWMNGGSYADCGTSAAAPHVSGVVATLLQHYDWLHGYPELVKALLMATSINSQSWPINKYGAGKVDALAANWLFDYQSGYRWKTGYGTFTDTDHWHHLDLVVPSDAAKLVIYLTWMEPPADAASDHAVLNNLDLYLDREPLQDSGNGYDWDWKSESFKDNVERIIVNSPSSGNYQIKIFPVSLDVGRAPTQKYAVAYMIVRGPTSPSLDVGVDAPSVVNAGQSFTFKATLAPASYMASGVYSKITVPQDVLIQSATTTRKDGTVRHYDGAAGVNLGNILFYTGYERTVTWSLSASSYGQKTISLDVCGSNSDCRVVETTVRVNAPPAAGFTFSPASPTTADSVLFTDTSTDDAGVASWSWSFGDGSSSSERNPFHRYASAGAYSVTLTVTDGSGATSTKSTQISVSDPVTPPPPPPETLLSEDFEDGNANGWNSLSGSMSVIAGNLDGSGSYVLKVTSDGDTPSGVLYSGGTGWLNYNIDVQFREIETNDPGGDPLGSDPNTYVNVYFYQQSASNANNGYKLHIRGRQGTTSLFKVVNGADTQLITTCGSFDQNQLRKIKIKTTPAAIEYVITDHNGNSCYSGLPIEDSTFRSGAVGVAAHTGVAGTYVTTLFDNIVVKPN
ncbi:S8 family serine peptidase [Candidatus Micrarchaeota archaeon]|nr:S8 family serine peptidase [Candidatus Micrarchaeota archaeon]